MLHGPYLKIKCCKVKTVAFYILDLPCLQFHNLDNTISQSNEALDQSSQYIIQPVPIIS